MKRFSRLAWLLGLIGLLPLCAGAADGAAMAGQRIIVKWKGGTGRSSTQAFAAAADNLHVVPNARLAQVRAIDGRRAVLHFDRALAGGEFQAALQELRAQPDVEYAVMDERRHILATPNDPYFAGSSGESRTGQWYLQNAEVAALNAVAAWDSGNVMNLSSNSVVAVVDTGARLDHPDLTGKFLPGYDFISCDQTSCTGTNRTYLIANDGDGWDADPSDPGDWISTADLQRSDNFFKDCTDDGQPSNSSWHGTRIAGIIGAASNNGVGIAGTGWNTRILPVRAMGKCGGYDSDIIAAMRWAGGLSVSGAPANPYPAKVINLSIGSVGACTAAYQDTINELTAVGVVIVASAGNEGGPVDAPANCAGVISVVGVRNVGTKVGYSSLGSNATIAAPAGNCVNTAANSPCLFSIETTTNQGTTTPGANSYTNQLNYNIGTSFSAPIVAGVASMMLAVNGNLRPNQLIGRLRSAAQPFPTNPNTGTPTCHVPTGSSDLQTLECYCTTSTCGAGLTKADQAVTQALRPIAAVALPGSISAGQAFTLNAASSAAACGRSIASYSWIVSGGTPPAGFADSHSASLTVVAPSSGSYVLTLTVSDDMGASDTAAVTVTATAATTAAAASAGSSACMASVSYSGGNTGGATPLAVVPAQSDGGGGSTDAWELGLLAAMAARRRKKRAANLSAH